MCESDFIRRVSFYYRHKEFIDGCVERLRARGIHEVDAERICYELAGF